MIDLKRQIIEKQKSSYISKNFISNISKTKNQTHPQKPTEPSSSARRLRKPRVFWSPLVHPHTKPHTFFSLHRIRRERDRLAVFSHVVALWLSGRPVAARAFRIFESRNKLPERALRIFRFFAAQVRSFRRYLRILGFSDF